VGSVHGIFGSLIGSKQALVVDFLRKLNFEKGIVPHAGGLKKIEVGQMNEILNGFLTNKIRAGQ
jgi:hypothetical protein